jgi:hypothetical protein
MSLFACGSFFTLLQYKMFAFFFLILHPVAHYTTILNEGTTFCNKLWVFSLSFYFMPHYMFWPISRPSSGAY